MKWYKYLASAVVVMLLCWSSVYSRNYNAVIFKKHESSTNTNYLNGIKLNSIEGFLRDHDGYINKNYIDGLKSNDLGLRISSAYYLGQRRSSKAIIPLMHMLHTDKSPQARITAALSLIKINDSRGVYAVQEASTNDNNKEVRKMCGKFYNMYLQNENNAG